MAYSKIHDEPLWTQRRYPAKISLTPDTVDFCLLQSVRPHRTYRTHLPKRSGTGLRGSPAHPGMLRPLLFPL